jgi:hypothetical protein
LVQCLFLLYSLFLCVAYAVEVSFDKKACWRPYRGLSNDITLNPPLFSLVNAFKAIV